LRKGGEENTIVDNFKKNMKSKMHLGETYYWWLFPHDQDIREAFQASLLVIMLWVEIYGVYIPWQVVSHDLNLKEALKGLRNILCSIQRWCLRPSKTQLSFNNQKNTQIRTEWCMG
jgi:hypothetical protein